MSFKYDSQNLTFILSFDGENYQTLEPTTYSHASTFGLANYKGKAFTTGCCNSTKCYKKTELLDMTTMKWSHGPDYPFSK